MMEVSLRQQLEAFLPCPKQVHDLIQHYWALVQVNPSWRIGAFIALIKEEMKK
jgi:hypothetical protein